MWNIAPCRQLALQPCGDRGAYRRDARPFGSVPPCLVCGSSRAHRVHGTGDPAATGRVLELSMGTPLDNDHPSPVGRELALPVDRSRVGGVASRGWYAAGVTILPTPGLLHGPETPDAQKLTVAIGRSSVG